VHDDLPNGVRGIDRYRALLAHLSAHRRWTSNLVADNLSPFQRSAVEIFEDSRVEYLAMQDFPGLRQLWCKLHPVPQEDIEKKRVTLHPPPHGDAVARFARPEAPLYGCGHPQVCGALPETDGQGETRSSDAQLLGVQLLRNPKWPATRRQRSISTTPRLAIAMTTA
jgi:hypothetical protein